MLGTTRGVADAVLAFRQEQLSDEVIQTGSLVLLDTVGCILGGRDSDTVAALTPATAELGSSHPRVSAVGVSRPVTLPSALFINGAALRFLDYNDTQFSADGVAGQHGHNSELVPLVLALAEAYDMTGQQLLCSMIIGYELSTRFTSAVAAKGLEGMGWSVDSRSAFSVPFVAGYMLGMSSAETAMAVSLSLSRGALLQAIDSRKHPTTMARNLRFAIGAYHALLNCDLIRGGLQAPEDILEREGGFIDTVLGGQFDVKGLGDPIDGTAILNAGLKRFAAAYATHGHIEATLEIARSEAIRPEDISAIRIRVTAKGYEHAGHPSRRTPLNKEEADHSSYFATAAALVCGDVGPAQYSDGWYRSPEIQRIANLTEVVWDADLDAEYPAAIVEIETVSSETLVSHVSQPSGHPSNPLTEKDVVDKFLKQARQPLGPELADRVCEGILGIGSSSSHDQVSLIAKSLTATSGGLDDDD